MVLRGVREKKHGRGKECSGKRYIYFFHQLTTIFSNSHFFFFLEREGGRERGKH